MTTNTYQPNLYKHTANHKETGNFTIISNDTLYSELSLKAKGLLSILLSYPPNWRLNINELRKKANCGETELRTILKELKQKGFYEVKRIKDHKNQFTGAIHHIYEISKNFINNTLRPRVDNPHYGESTNREFQNVESSEHIIKTDVTNTDFINTDFNKTSSYKEQKIESPVFHQKIKNEKNDDDLSNKFEKEEKENFGIEELPDENGDIISESEYLHNNIKTDVKMIQPVNRPESIKEPVPDEPMPSVIQKQYEKDCLELTEKLTNLKNKAGVKIDLDPYMAKKFVQEKDHSFIRKELEYFPWRVDKNGKAAGAGYLVTILTRGCSEPPEDYKSSAKIAEITKIENKNSEILRLFKQGEEASCHEGAFRTQLAKAINTLLVSKKWEQLKEGLSKMQNLCTIEDTLPETTLRSVSEFILN